MKKSIFISVLALAMVWSASAQQKVAVINTQKVYKAIPAYTAAVAELDSLAKSYQKTVDEAYAKLEDMYNNYMVAKDGLSQDEQQSREQKILSSEQKITKYQESIFGTDGTIAKKQEELLKPFQEQVAAVVKQVAEQEGLDLVVDVAANPVPYYSPAIDKTDQIINLINNKTTTAQ